MKNRGKGGPGACVCCRLLRYVGVNGKVFVLRYRSATLYGCREKAAKEKANKHWQLYSYATLDGGPCIP